MPTIAEIKAAAFDGVSAAIPDAIHAAELFEPVKTYNAATKENDIVPTTRGTGRALKETARVAKDKFPEHVAGPGEYVYSLEGFTTPPKKGWTLQVNGTDYEIILPPLDELDAGTSFLVMVR